MTDTPAEVGVFWAFLERGSVYAFTTMMLMVAFSPQGGVSAWYLFLALLGFTIGHAIYTSRGTPTLRACIRSGGGA